MAKKNGTPLNGEEIASAIQASIAESISQFGVAVMCVFASEDAPGFAYTCGLTDLGHPEVIMFGLRPEHSHPFLNAYYEMIKVGRINPGVGIISQMFTLPLALITAPEENAGQFAIQCEAYYRNRGRKPKYMQAVMSDKNGLLPWQAGFDHVYMDRRQPVLNENPETLLPELMIIPN